MTSAASSVRVLKTQGLTHLLPLSRFALQQALEAMLEALGLEGCEVELALLDEAAMAALNFRHLGCVGPTNVLSFPADPEDVAHAAGGCVLGQLALAPHTVRREAFLYGQDLSEHTMRLLAHGLAHLAGFDHGEEMDALAEAAQQAGLATAASFSGGVCIEYRA